MTPDEKQEWQCSQAGNVSWPTNDEIAEQVGKDLGLKMTPEPSFAQRCVFALLKAGLLRQPQGAYLAQIEDSNNNIYSPAVQIIDDLHARESENSGKMILNLVYELQASQREVAELKEKLGIIPPVSVQWLDQPRDKDGNTAHRKEKP